MDSEPHPRWLSLDLRAALLTVMRLEHLPDAAWPRDAAWISNAEGLLFLGYVEPDGEAWRVTDAGWQWVIATGLERGAGVVDDDWTNGEAAVWSTLGDVLEHIEAADEDGRGEWSAAASGAEAAPARMRDWVRGRCASRARAARRARRRGRRPPEGGCART